MSEVNRKTVERVYGAFQAGDIPTILRAVTDGTRWDFNVARSDVPWHVPTEGKDQLPRFFERLGAGVTMEAFEPRAFVSGERDVIVKLRVAYTVRKTGRRVDQEQVQWWSFDESGLIAGLRHFEDTAAVVDAWGR